MHQNCRGGIAEALMEDGLPRPSHTNTILSGDARRRASSIAILRDKQCGRERSNLSTSLTAQKNLCAQLPKLAPYPALVLRATATRWGRALSSSRSHLTS